jgi:saccharopine dehydrogenase-like NADP-dependent oxidoreductase
MKNVLIIGTGAQGNVISNVLKSEDDIGNIVLADLMIERAHEIVEYADSSKIKPVKLDASDRSIITDIKINKQINQII